MIVITSLVVYPGGFLPFFRTAVLLVGRFRRRLSLLPLLLSNAAANARRASSRFALAGFLELPFREERTPLLLGTGCTCHRVLAFVVWGRHRGTAF
jgi:hypothetical protein